MKDEDWVDAIERKLRPSREYISADEYSKRVQKCYQWKPDQEKWLHQPLILQ